jgi:hypothetical protein
VQYGEDEVREHLNPYHDRILRVIEQGYGEWASIKRSMASSGTGPVLYPPTTANYVFDAIARHAITEFSADPEVRVYPNAQTVKFCFKDVVLARFKKGDEDNLGRNHPTQAVLDFVSIQSELPGMPPSATKVEVLYTANEIEDRIERVVVAARDGDELLWHYEIVPSAASTSSGTGITLLPMSTEPLEDAAEASEELVVLRKRQRDDDTSDSNGN